ncbi:DUF6896 domain-containing protein [Pseudomonas danubii]|uniref:DUF6896 domain-containing protein n=1 Tax=Pseudomonas danubii TaxID=2497146 RepID=UPI00373FDCAE
MQQSAIPLPASNADWVGTDIPDQGELAGGIRYFKHGFGCAVHLPTATVSFDFGEQGEIDGVTLSRLAGFAENRLLEYGFADENELKHCFDNEVAAGSLVYSGYILYYVATAKPQARRLEDSHPLHHPSNPKAHHEIHLSRPTHRPKNHRLSQPGLRRGTDDPSNAL